MTRRRLPRVTRADARACSLRALACVRSLRYMVKRWKRIDAKERALMLAWSDHAANAVAEVARMVRAVRKAPAPRSPWLQSPEVPQP